MEAATSAPPIPLNKLAWFIILVVFAWQCHYMLHVFAVQHAIHSVDAVA